MWVRVTKRDIKNGSRGEAFTCPVARALSRTLKDSIGVGGDTWESENVAGPSGVLPENIRNWVSNFDAFGGYAVKPIAFQIKKPS
jgi:hypothetical protein